MTGARRGSAVAAGAVALALAGADLHAQATGNVRWDPERITAEEIAARAPDARNAYEVIQRLRPSFLRKRSTRNVQSEVTEPIKVYVDGAYRGTPETLRELMRDGIVEIVHLSGPDATTRFGTGHNNGAILVRMGF